MIVKFGPWAPDQADMVNGWGQCAEAKNCLPQPGGYVPFPDAQTFGTSVTASVTTAAYSIRDLDNNGYTFAGTANNLLKMSATGTWENVNRVAAYSTLDTTRWRFAAFGNRLLAVNGLDAMQGFTLGTSSAFADLSASAAAPVATYIAVVRNNFVFAGRIASANNRVQWCQFNNPDRWTRSQQNQSDFQDLSGEGGNVVGITGGDFAAVFTDRSVHRFSYIGAPAIFRVDELAPNTGCIAPGSIARYQNVTFFLSGNGFMAFDGNQAISIGDQWVDDWFFNNVDTSSYHRISTTIDPDRKLYILSFPSTATTNGSPDKLLIYNFETQRWSNGTHNVDVLFSAISRGGYTLEQLDSFGTVDTLTQSLDSEFWTASKQNVLAAINANHVLVTFNGTPKTATIITGESQIVPSYRALMTSVRPLVQGGSSVTVQIGKRNRLGDSVTWSTASSLNSTGLCPVRANARFHRVRMDVSGTWERIIGFDPVAVQDGMR